MSATIRSRIIRLTLWTLAGAILVFAVLVASIPFILPRLHLSKLSYDLSEQLPPDLRRMFRHTKATASPLFISTDRDISLRCRGRILDWPYSLDADIDYSLLHRSAEGSFSLSLDGTAAKVSGRFAGSSSGGWTVDAELPATSFSDADPLFNDLLIHALGSATTNLTNLACSGRLGFEAHAFTTNALALPTWSAQIVLSDVNASTTGSPNDFAVRKARARVGVTGLGPHFDISPMFPRADAVEVGGIALTNIFASIRATERSLLVTEGGADVCGGQLRFYALFLDPARLNAGVTLFLDNIDTGMVINRLSGFSGSATGRLHGKLPIMLRQGERISLGDGYLYSVPGETGTLRIEEAAPLLENLAASGVSPSDCENLSKAFRSLSYTALKLDLRKDEDGTHALNFKLEGSATEGKKTVPVSLDVTLHGEIEKLINVGLKAAGR